MFISRGGCVGPIRRLCVVAVALLGVIGSVDGQQPATGEWPYWGADAGQTKYSALDDITPANVQRLELAWTWETLDKSMSNPELRPGALRTTPLMIDNVLYVNTSFDRIAAPDPDTGRQLWAFDPHTYEGRQPLSGSGLASRGTAFWRGTAVQTRILIAGRQHLFSIDAKTGKLDVRFGDGGLVSLTRNLGRDVPRLQTHVSSPPLVYKNLAIVGHGTSDRVQYPSDPPGVVQAFNIQTGNRAWVFFTIPQSASDAGADTWANASWKSVGHANVWAPMALDEARGLLYVAT